tara:strand:+ start:2416 stop:2697 length:282 start_codon:yes stop_codon:yes gene_type:complete
MKTTKNIFNNYQKLLNPFFKAFGIFESEACQFLIDPYSKQVKHEVTLDPASEANGWKFSMSFTYDLSENKNKEEVSKALNLLISEGADPLSKK